MGCFGNLDNESDVPFNPNHFVPIFKRRVDNFKGGHQAICTKNTAHNVDPQISASGLLRMCPMFQLPTKV